ncbi:MAG: DUF5361 domain-containing protein [Galactobacter sp.]
MRLRDLGTPGFTWTDLRAIVKHLPATSAYWRAREPEASRWGVSEYLLAIIADATRWLVWAKTKDARRGRNRPQPIPRPGDAERAKRGKQGHFHGAVSRTVDEVKRLLSRPRR